MDDEALQGLRRLVEETIVEKDWALALITLDVTDQLLYRVLFAHLDDAALTGGAPAYSLAAQHLAEWFKDQRRWLDALYKTWTADPSWGRPTPRSSRAPSPTPSTGRAALRPLAARADALVGGGAAAALEQLADEVHAAHSAPKEA